MKKLILALFFVFLLSSLIFGQTDDWIIERNGDEILMRNPSSPDPSKIYRGTINKDGSVRMRNYTGDHVTGDLDKDGYGKLQDDYGNIYRIKH